jgi:hypothetical protein
VGARGVRGRVTVTELFDYVRPEDIEVEAGLVERAITAGIRAPAPIRSDARAVIAKVDGANWRAHRWVRLGPAPTKPPAPGTAAAAGRVLARLHALALPAPRPVVRWLTHRRPEQAWLALVHQARRQGAVWADALAAAVPAFLTLDAVRDDRDPNARAILSHASLSPEVVRIAGRDQSLSPGGSTQARSRPTGSSETRCDRGRRAAISNSAQQRHAPCSPPTASSQTVRMNSS